MEPTVQIHARVLFENLLRGLENVVRMSLIAILEHTHFLNHSLGARKI
jgi:hypothetical protein